MGSRLNERKEGNIYCGVGAIGSSKISAYAIINDAES